MFGSDQDLSKECLWPSTVIVNLTNFVYPDLIYVWLKFVFREINSLNNWFTCTIIS